MRRVAAVFVGAMSLAMAVAAMAIWPRTPTRCDGVAYLGRADVQYALHTSPGGVCFERTDNVRRRHDPHDPEPVKEGWSAMSRPWGWTRRYTWFEPAVPSAPQNLMLRGRPGSSAGGAANFYTYVINAYSVVDTLTWEEPPHRFLGFGWSATSQAVPVFWKMP